MIFIVIAIPAVLLPTWPATKVHVSIARKTSDVFADARSVQLIELVPWSERIGQSDTEAAQDLILQSIVASPEQIAQFRTAMGGFFDYGRVSLYNCFDPHHRVEITHADGTVTRLNICFQCKQLVFDHDRLQPIPTLMRSRLEQFFVSVGMKLKDPKEYYELGSKH